MEFDKNVVDIFSDEEIAGLAKLGYEDMAAEHAREDARWKDEKSDLKGLEYGTPG